MNREYQKNEKRVAIIDYVKKNEPVEQSEIATYFYEEFNYKNLISARSSISRILAKLEASGVLTKTVEMNHSSGSIDKNVWRVNQ